MNALGQLNAAVNAIEEKREYRAALRAVVSIAKALTPKKVGPPPHAACFFKDGTQWCCVLGNFIDLQESPAGFGQTMDEALANLNADIDKGRSP